MMRIVTPRKRLWRVASRQGVQDEAGLTLIMVLGIMSVMTLFLLGSLVMVLNNAAPSRRTQDSTAAAAAAQAGVEDYMSRLRADDSYFLKGNTDPSNPAFSQAGTAISGSNSQYRRYRYQLASSPEEMARDGLVRLRVTGMSGPDMSRLVSRTMMYTIQPRSFLDYAYLSDYEAVDPELTYENAAVQYYDEVNPPTYFWNGNTRYIYVDPGAGVRRECGKYYKDWRWQPELVVTPETPLRVLDLQTKTLLPEPVVTSGKGYQFWCKEIGWVDGDVVNGPFHTNDAINLIGHPLFKDPKVSTFWGKEGKYWYGPGSPDPDGYSPYYAYPISLPETNTEMKRWVQPNVIDPSKPGPGCYYTGATKIVFQGTTMRVHSPGTTNPGVPSRCLDVGNSANEQTGKPIPPVIYVDATTNTCTTGVIGYPKPEEWLYGTTTEYDCHRGSAYVSGTVDSRVTIVTLDDTVITGNLVTKDNRTGTDMIGIVSGNYIWIYHPVDRTSTHENLDPGNAVRRIDAGMITLRRSLVVQNYTEGAALSVPGRPETNLQINGSISQRYRGPVGVNEDGQLLSGYLKEYNYDSRFKVMQPPYFIKAKDTQWQIREIIDTRS